MFSLSVGLRLTVMVKGVCTFAKVTRTAEAIPICGFLSLKRLGILLFSFGRKLVHRRFTTDPKFSLVEQQSPSPHLLSLGQPEAL